MTTGRRALVLGADGFIGRRLCRHLRTHGWNVYGGVRSTEGPSVDTAAFRDNKRMIAIDESDGMQNALAQSEPAVVFNLAAAGVGRKVPYTSLVDGNAGIVARLLELLDPEKTTTVVHAGSWSQYRIDTPSSLITEATPMEPTSAYGAAKVGAEVIGRAIADEIGVAFLTLRLFNVYGPGENPARLIPYVISAVSNGVVAALTTGEQVRDFVYVDDVASAFEACGRLAQPVSQSFNVATGIGTPVRAVAIEAAQAAGGGPRSLGFGTKTPRENEPPSVVGDASALTKATGWKPQISISEGVERTVRAILNGGAMDD